MALFLQICMTEHSTLRSILTRFYSTNLSVIFTQARYTCLVVTYQTWGQYLEKWLNAVHFSNWTFIWEFTIQWSYCPKVSTLYSLDTDDLEDLWCLVDFPLFKGMGHQWCRCCSKGVGSAHKGMAREKPAACTVLSSHRCAAKLATSNDDISASRALRA